MTKKQKRKLVSEFIRGPLAEFKKAIEQEEQAISDAQTRRREVNADFGAKVRELRIALGVNANDFAQELGVHPPFLSIMERGGLRQWKPKLNELKKALRAVASR